VRYCIIDPCYANIKCEESEIFYTGGDGLKVIKVDKKVVGTVGVDSGRLCCIPYSQITEHKSVKQLGLTLELNGSECITAEDLFDWQIAEVELVTENIVGVLLYNLPIEIAESLELIEENNTVILSFMGEVYNVYLDFENLVLICPKHLVSSMNSYYKRKIPTNRVTVEA